MTGPRPAVSRPTSTTLRSLCAASATTSACLRRLTTPSTHSSRSSSTGQTCLGAVQRLGRQGELRSGVGRPGSALDQGRRLRCVYRARTGLADPECSCLLGARGRWSPPGTVPSNVPRALSAAYYLMQTAMEKISARIAVSEAARQTLVKHLGGDAVLVPNGVVCSDLEGATTASRLPATGPDAVLHRSYRRAAQRSARAAGRPAPDRRGASGRRGVGRWPRRPGAGH